MVTASATTIGSGTTAVILAHQTDQGRGGFRRLSGRQSTPSWAGAAEYGDYTAASVVGKLAVPTVYVVAPHDERTPVADVRTMRVAQVHAVGSADVAEAAGRWCRATVPVRWCLHDRYR